MGRNTPKTATTVYALIDQGKGNRSEQHQKVVLKTLDAEIVLDREATKDQRIRQILERGETVRAICLSDGYGDEADAYRAESLAIEVVGRLLASHDRPPLTNAFKQTSSGFHELNPGGVLLGGELAIDAVDSTSTGSGRQSALLVKGSREEMEAGGQRLVRDFAFTSGLDAVRERITVLAWDDEQPTYRRPAWDPTDAWGDAHARERARRYWPIGKDTVNAWIKDPDSCPEVLLLGVPTGGRTIVRYAWMIDREGTWEYFPESSRWGVPLGARVFDHRCLGKALYETRESGKQVQVLAGYAAGWRVLDV